MRRHASKDRTVQPFWNECRRDCDVAPAIWRSRAYPSAGFQDAMKFGDYHVGILDVLEYPIADDQVDGRVFERKRGVRRDENCLVDKRILFHNGINIGSDDLRDLAFE